ncbi:hypothetical protein CANINC_001414 [Pichia inconspicua]|uniref:Ras-GEF domain-containing protein n=1 Tax=Pichia inconspicua TaxID=52247 RepID=A0A4T0X451_9ASCO|nr:hypothetical protein CANINC_001414 [[Candida] inconspicua]
MYSSSTSSSSSSPSAPAYPRSNSIADHRLSDQHSDLGLDIEQLLNNFDENEPIFNNELLYPTPKESEILHFDNSGNTINGTVEALLTYMTSPDVLNYQFQINFFLTFRSYMDPLPLLELLLCRLSWSLKKSLSDDNNENYYGRLILIRCFVTIRHWLLNHFQDDFINNIVLRSLFTNTINEFTKHERYRGKDLNSLQCKILKDLKKVYLTLAAIYWDIEYDQADLINTNISSYDDLNQSRLSILGMNQLNDPATRRSTLLYMLDNPNSSNALNDALKNNSSNIFNTEKISIDVSPLATYLRNKLDHSNSENKKNSSLAGNTVLYPKDSLNLFDIKRLKNSSSLNSSIDQIYTSLFENGPVPGFVDLNRQGENLSTNGFTTSGHIKIFKDSTVNKIKTSSPSTLSSSTFSQFNDITKKTLLTENERGKNRVKAKKRSFIKSLFIQNSKENIYHMTPPAEVKEPLKSYPATNDSVEVISCLEKEINPTDKNMDYLEELLIRDYQLIIQHPNFKQRVNKQFGNNKRRSVLSMSFDLADRDSKFNPLDSPTKKNLLNYNNNDLETSMNLHSSKIKSVERSFRTPSYTIDWSDSMNVDETSEQFVDMNGILNNNENLEFDDVVNGSENQYFEPHHENTSSIDAVSTTNKDTHNPKSRISLQNSVQLNRLSRISRKEKCISDSKILLNQKSDDFKPSRNHNTYRFSAKMLNRNSEISMKSYLTYDSAFSESSELSNNDDAHNNILSRKQAISNLRINRNSFEDIETNSIDSADNIIEYEERKSIDALSCLQRLPFFGFVSSNSNTESTVSMIPSPTASQACCTALSPHDINELAAIPDQTLDDDPLNYTLNKLRGDRAKGRITIGLNDDRLDEEESHRKHAVAVVCESPDRNNQHNFFTIDQNMNSDDSNNELEIERQVRDLIITSKPSDSTRLEMNLVSTQTLGKKDNGSVLTRVSTGQLLKDDAEKSYFEIQSLLTTPKTGLQTTKLLLSVEQVMDMNVHIPFILKYDTDVLATQMTLIERDIILEIDWKELIYLKWDQPLVPYNSWLRLLVDLSKRSCIELITLRFNLVNNWIISEILLCKENNLRILAVTRFIQLAHKCREIQNYGTLFQIMLALNSEIMKQLKSTWIRIDPGTILKFKELKDLTSPNNDFENYRKEIEKIVPSKGFIPFLPLGLSDLTMYSEMPTLLPSSEFDDLDSLTGFDAESAATYDLINFKKFSLIGETVKNTLRYIEWSKFYNFESNPEVLSKCLYISSLSEEDMTICLRNINVDIDNL